MISDNQQVISLGYKKLIAWQKADLLAKEIYKITYNFPKDEVFGITSQIRRAALSVPANIIEGYARINKNHFRNFLSISLGSLAELEYFLGFSFEQKYMSKQDFENIQTLKEECGRILWRLYQSQQ